MTINREHLAGLELALDRWNDGGPSVQYAALLHDLIAQAQAAPEAEPVELRGLRPVLAMILNALDRDAAEGKAARGEMAEELRAKLATLSAKNEGGKA